MSSLEQDLWDQNYLDPGFLMPIGYLPDLGRLYSIDDGGTGQAVPVQKNACERFAAKDKCHVQQSAKPEEIRVQAGQYAEVERKNKEDLKRKKEAVEARRWEELRREWEKGVEDWEWYTRHQDFVRRIKYCAEETEHLDQRLEAEYGKYFKGDRCACGASLEMSTPFGRRK